MSVSGSTSRHALIGRVGEATPAADRSPDHCRCSEEASCGCHDPPFRAKIGAQSYCETMPPLAYVLSILDSVSISKTTGRWISGEPGKRMLYGGQARV